MKRLILLLSLALVGSQVQAARITDKLLAGLYAEPKQSNEPIRVLPSGTPFETLGSSNGYTRVRLGDRTEGWVESRFVTNEKPARVMLLEAQAKNSQLQQALREARQKLARLEDGDAPIAGDAELEQLRQQLATAQQEIEQLREAQSGTPPSAQVSELQEENSRLKEALNVSQDALNRTLNELNAQPNGDGKLLQENMYLRQQINQAAEILGAPVDAPAASAGSSRFGVWQLPLVALGLLGSFIGGIAFKNHRISKRYGGFRV